MQKWQYDVVELDFRGADTHDGLDDRRTLLTTLEEFGAQGWELVNAQVVGEKTYLFLKTPVIELHSSSQKPQSRGLISLFTRS